MDRTDIGTEIRNRRRVLGLTQEQVAELAGVARRTIIDLESGQGSYGPTLEKVHAICTVLGLDLRVTETNSFTDHG